MNKSIKVGHITLITGPMCSGKCLGYNTGVRLSDMSLKNVQDVIVGDELLDPYTEHPTKVLSITTGYGKLYKVSQSDGIEYIVNDDHILTLNYNDEHLDIPVTDYINTNLDKRDKLKGIRSCTVNNNLNKSTYILSNINVTPNGYGNYYGFTLNGNGHFYLSDYTITHNTTELLRLLYRKAQVKNSVAFVGHTADDRSDAVFSTHNPLYRTELKCKLVDFIQTSKISDIFDKLKHYDVVGIDEGQWYDDLFSCTLALAESYGVDVFVSGLSSNFQRKGYPQIKELYSICFDHLPLTAICKRCPMDTPGKESVAIYTYKYPRIRIDGNEDDVDSTDFSIQPGASDKYMPVCPQCYNELSNIKHNKIDF